MKYLHVFSLIALSFAALSLLHRVMGNTNPTHAALFSAPALMIDLGKDQEVGLLIGE
jgi:hypothetical protein